MKDVRHARISLAVHLVVLTLLCLLVFRTGDQAQCAPVVQAAALPPAPPAQAEPAPQQAPTPDPQPPRPRAPRVVPSPGLPGAVEAPKRPSWGVTDLDREIAAHPPVITTLEQ